MGSQKLFRSCRAFCLSALILAAGCSSMTQIQPVQSSKSGFDGAVYEGETQVLAENPGVEEFRVFHQAATGYVSVESVRQSAKRRATDFCANTGKQMMEFSETYSTPPHILGNFPRIELIFGCIEPTPTVSTDQQKYQALKDAKALLDSGALTQQEYEREKAKILSRP